jgi:phenylacetate-CoA ligase
MDGTMRRVAARNDLRTASEAADARQRRALARTLASARRLPGYAEACERIPAGVDPFEALRAMPVLERAAVQDAPDAYRDRGQPSLRMTTSGSTGTPLVIHVHPRARRRRRRQFAGFFWRHGWRPWHRSLSLKVLPDPSARLGSTLLDGTVLRRRRSASVLEPLERQYRCLREVDPQILHGLPTVIAELAARAEGEGWRPKRLRAIFTASEALTDATRRHIQASLSAPVVDSYAAVEAFVGWQCERREGFHINTGSVVVEILDAAGRPTAPGEVGRVALTTLDNPAMPLMRYAIGDMAIAGDGRRCPCGRPGPLLPRVLGRQVPFLLVGGRQVSPWGVLARAHEFGFIRQVQLVQPAPDVIWADVLPRPGRAVDEWALRQLILAQLGEEARVEVRTVEEYRRLPSGKSADGVVAPALSYPAERAGADSSGEGRALGPQT